MKSKLSLVGLLLLAVSVLVVPAAKAQNGAFAPYVTIGVTGSGTGSVLQSTTPSGNVGVGIESSTTHLLLDVNFQESFTNGLSTASGVTAAVDGSGYLKLSHFLVGGGAFYSNQVTGYTTVSGGEGSTVAFFQSVNLTQTRPYVGGGLMFPRFTLTGDYIIPGGFTVTGFPNLAVADRSFRFKNDINLSNHGILKHVRFTQNLSFSSNLTGTSQTRTNTWTGGGGLKFIL